MTLFTKEDCVLCDRLKGRFDLAAMDVVVEVLDDRNSGALAHLAWHSLVETARKTLPVLVLDDCTSVAEFSVIERHLAQRASAYGVAFHVAAAGVNCEGDSCSFN